MLDPITAAAIYGLLRARAFELTGDSDSADDLTQETLLYLLEHQQPRRAGTERETLRYARMTMRSIFLREFLGKPRRPLKAPLFA
jgi:DNA-directed RNA polymerase specialized sigma24 family protein